MVLCEDRGLERELGRWMLTLVMNGSTTPSNSISRLTSCSELNLHENQIHKFSHSFDQEFWGCYCSLWIVVKVMADGNVSWNVCRHSFPFLSQDNTRKSSIPSKDQSILDLEWSLDLSPSFQKLQSETGLCSLTLIPVTFPTFQYGFQESEHQNLGNTVITNSAIETIEGK